MSKKKYIISTSAAIALTLFNAGVAQATEQAETPSTELKTNVQDAKEEAVNWLEWSQQFEALETIEPEKLTHLFADETLTKVLEQALVHIEEEEFEVLIVLLEESLPLFEENELATTLLEQFIEETALQIAEATEAIEETEVKPASEEEVTLEEDSETTDTQEEVVVPEEKTGAATASLFKAQGQIKSADAFVKEYQDTYYVSELWTISQAFKKAYPNDQRVDVLINDAAENNLAEGLRAHNVNNFERAIIYYDRVMSEDRVADTITAKANIYKKEALNAQKVKTADELYSDYKNAYYISDKWLITQDFKALYPTDARLPQIINEVTEKNFAEGRYNHSKNNFANATSYYSRILDEESINGSKRAQVEVLYDLATQKQPMKTANDYYKAYNDAFYVSHLWEISQEFKLMYPNDSRVLEVINDAARNNMAEGQRAHRRKDYSLALVYYNRVANEPLISNAIRNELNIYTKQAQNKQALKTADDYYKDYQDAFYVSDLWTISQEFKQAFPNDARVSETVNDAAKNNVAEGQRAHRRKDYSTAAIYYNRVLSESSVASEIANQAKVFLRQAESKQPLKSANDYYNDYKKAFYVSDLWAISQAFKNDFPNDSRVIEVINDAARNNMAEGQRAHRRKDYNTALIYYNRVLNEQLIHSNLRSELNTYANQAKSRSALKTADDYVKDFDKAYFVSHLWSISQSFKKDFPQDKRVVDMVNQAAIQNMAEGQIAHKRKDYSLALTYYNRVLSENLIHASLRSEINTYVKQASSNRPLKTPEDYVKDYEKTYYVSDLWAIAQNFKTDFPDDHRLVDVVNHAALKNLAEGQRAHDKKNYSTAAIYYNRVNSEEMVDSSIRNKADAYYYLATNNMNLTNTIVRTTQYDITLSEMIEIQTNLKGAKPQIWDTVNGNPFRDATKAEVAYNVNPKNSMPSDLSRIDYLLTTVEVNTNILNVRKGPSTLHGVIGQAFRGERYTILDQDQSSGWYKISFNGLEGWVAGSSAYVKRTSVLQHLKLSGSSGISVADLNKELEGAGILEGHGATFRKASQEANVNELYLIAHALLETGHGTSPLATGIKVNGKMTYNMYGIGAFDNDAHKYGSERAYELGWFTPEKAIIEGAKWISNSYINNPYYRQDTLYKMRWNPASPGNHQYATDVRWAESQLGTLDSIILLSQKYDAILNFDVPLYKK